MGNERPDGCLLRVARQVRDLWVIAGVTLIVILLLDGVLRNVLPGGTSESVIDPSARRLAKREADAYDGTDWARDYYREYGDSTPTRWEPYSYWRRQPFNGRYINIDDEGLRQTWNPPDDPSAAAVWILGGSTMWGTGARDGHTIPSELSRLLAADGMPVKMTNLGEAGYVSTQELVTLLRRLQRGERPKLVIFYDGVNDVYAAILENVAGVPMNEINRRREFNATNTWGGLARGALRRLRGLGRLAAIVGGRPAPERPATLAADVVTSYEHNVQAVRALGSTYGFETLFFWQPSVFTKRRVTEFERRTRDSRLTVHRDLQLEANRLVREAMPADEDTAFVDLSATLDSIEDPLYLDFCHLSEEGNRLIAKAMLPSVRQALQDQAGK